MLTVNKFQKSFYKDLYLHILNFVVVITTSLVQPTLTGWCTSLVFLACYLFPGRKTTLYMCTNVGQLKSVMLGMVGKMKKKPII